MQQQQMQQQQMQQQQIYSNNQFSTFVNNLHICLTQEDDNVTKRMLQELKSSLSIGSGIPIDMNSDIVMLLYSSDRWPKVDSRACFVEGCDFKASTEGLLRVHLCNAHMFDSGKARDELINIVSYMANSTITTIYDKCNGTTKTPDKHMILCHFPNCGYATERDFRIKKHRDRHRRFNEHIHKLGRFWGTLKSWIEVTNSFPSIGSFLGEGEMWNCNLCDFISSTSQNVRDHIGCTHKNLNEIEKNETLIPIHLKFEFNGNPLICMNDAPRKNNLELINDLTRDEILEACDIAYSNSLNEISTNEAASDQQIDPLKIVTRQTNQIASSDFLIPSQPVIENTEIIDDSEVHNITNPVTTNVSTLMPESQSIENDTYNISSDVWADSDLPLPNTIYLSSSCVNPNYSSNTNILKETPITVIPNSVNNSEVESEEEEFLVEDDYLSGEEELNLQLPNKFEESPLSSSYSSYDDILSLTEETAHTKDVINFHSSSNNSSDVNSSSKCLSTTIPDSSDDYTDFTNSSNLLSNDVCYNQYYLQNSSTNMSIQSSENDDQPNSQLQVNQSLALQIDNNSSSCNTTLCIDNNSNQRRSTLDQFTYNTPRKRSSKFCGSGRATDSNVPKSSCTCSSSLDNTFMNQIPFNEDRRIIQGMKWYQQAQTRGTVKLPKLDRSNRKLISEGIKELFNDELIPIIKDYNPDTLQNIDDEAKWRIFEGAYEEVIHRIRIHIATKLNLDPKKIYTNSHKRKWFNKTDEDLITIQLHTRLLNSLKTNIEKLNNIENDNNDANTDILRSRVANSLHLIDPEQRLQLFGSEDICTIVNDLSNVDFSNKCGEWLELKINECIKHEMSIKSASRQASRIQENYSDNPKKTLNNFIFNESKPNCPIDEDTLFNYFSKSFQKGNFIFQPDDEQGIFRLSRCFNNEDCEEFMNKLCDANLIKEVISSRKFNSAAGPDGIDYSIFKLSVNEATELVQCIMKIIISYKRVPKAWKDSNMTLIYKKGDLNSPENWRPISVSNAIYRIFSCIFAKTINSFNSHLHIYSSNQKGFLENINGCSDNSSIISELYYDAMRNHKSIYVTALDLQNAFGSVDHDMIIQCLKERGFPDDFCRIIENIYQGSTTKIITNRFTSKRINVKRGTKQGCPVSPLLFNLCLEPLFKAINTLNPDDGYSITWNNMTVSFNALAYADDLLIISDSLKGMNNILKVCDWFFKYSNLVLAASKSCSVGYIWEHQSRCSLKTPFKIGEVEIPFVNLDTSIKYLGTPVAARKITKLKSSEAYCNKFKVKALKIFNSDLRITQKIHAIKTFVFPTLDFILENGQLKIKDIEGLDHFVAKNINIMFQGNVPTALKHASWKDGGLSIPSLRDKTETCRIKALIRMLTNKDDRIKLLAQKALDNERSKRKIELIKDTEESTFFNWKHYNHDPHKGTNSIIQRARISLQNLNLSLSKVALNKIANIDGIEEEELHNNSINDEDTFILKEVTSDNKLTFTDSKKISLFLTTLRKKFWASCASKQSMHLHSLYSFADNPLSNSYILNYNLPASDSFIRFAIKSRVNILGTPEFDEIIHNAPHKPCPLCSFTGANATQSLAHILNGCVKRYPFYTNRHNRVQSVIINALKDLPHVSEIHKDSKIPISNLPEDLKLLRPDVVSWNQNRNKCIIIEISVPYATLNWGQDTLKSVYDTKRNKYARLIEFVRNEGIEVNFYVIIVSSLGAVLEESRSDIISLVKCKKKAKTLTKKIAANAIIGSMEIWNNFRGKTHSSPHILRSPNADNANQNDIDRVSPPIASIISSDSDFSETSMEDYNCDARIEIKKK